jgi:hypothetical protein
MNEASTAYNAGVISALEDELIQPWEKERLGKLTQWARLLINGLIKRIANNRAEIARGDRAGGAGEMTKFYRSSESGPEELVLTPRATDAMVEAAAKASWPFVNPHDEWDSSHNLLAKLDHRQAMRAALAAAQAVVPKAQTTKCRFAPNHGGCHYPDCPPDCAGRNDIFAPAPWPTEEQIIELFYEFARAVENDAWSQEAIDADMALGDEDGPEPGEECGRWVNGRLSHSCSKAGSEECDFECPYRNSLKF